MSLALTKAGELKPEIRLAQAISEFEAALADDSLKTKFRGYKADRPPDALDVFRLTAEIDANEKRRFSHRGVGPRLTNVLQSVQQFSAVVDFGVGASQNYIASSIWGVLKLSLQLAINASSFFEKLSELFMEIGRDCPLYQQLAYLYPQSPALQKSVCEYFIVICSLCKKTVEVSKRSGFVQIPFNTLKSFDGQFGSFVADLASRSNVIQKQILLASEQAQSLERAESSKFRALSTKRSNNVEKELQTAKERRRKKAIVRLLDACSTYDHSKAWKRFRKQGCCQWIFNSTEYIQWKSETASGSFWCKGPLGSGKSVLSANVVEDLIPKTTKSSSWSYFFCQYDDLESLSSRTIVGSLARQLIFQLQDHLTEELIEITAAFFGIDEILGLLLKLLPNTSHQHFLVLDGLDECSKDEILVCMQSIKQLLDSDKCFKVFWTSRPDLQQELTELLQENGRHMSLMEFAEKRDSELELFIESELERRLLSGALLLGADPTIALKIRERLLKEAGGMFLWVALQFDALCQESTDDNILKALENLPRDLAETFDRILHRLDYSTHSQVMTIFEIVTTSCRPLTVKEIREAISVQIGVTTWSPTTMVTDMQRALNQCGSLIIVDEEDGTIRFTHQSVMKHLVSGAAFRTIDIYEADLHLGDICVTYLASDRFQSQLWKPTTVPSVQGTDVTTHVVSNALPHSKSVNKLALKYLKSRPSPDIDLIGQMDVLSVRADEDLPHDFEFRAYALSFMFHHTRNFTEERETYRLWSRAFEKEYSEEELNSSKAPWADAYYPSCGRTGPCRVRAMMVKWSAENKHNLVLSFALRHWLSTYCLDYNKFGDIIIHRAALKLIFSDDILKRLTSDLLDGTLAIAAIINDIEGAESALKIGARQNHTITPFITSPCITPLRYVSEQGQRTFLEVLLRYGCPFDDFGSDEKTALIVAVERGYTAIANVLLKAGASVNGRFKTEFGGGGMVTPLQLSVMKGHVPLVQALIKQGADVNASGDFNALIEAVRKDYDTIVAALLRHGADLNAPGMLDKAIKLGRDGTLRTILDHVADNAATLHRKPDVLETLLKHKVNFDSLQVLRNAIKSSNDDDESSLRTVKLLLDRGIDVNTEFPDGSTLLDEAHGNKVIHLLKKRGAKTGVSSSKPFAPVTAKDDTSL